MRGVPRVPRGLTGAALAVLPQLVIAAAPALVLGQCHLHTVVFAAAVVYGTGVHHCREKDMKLIGKCCVAWRGSFQRVKQSSHVYEEHHK